MKKKTYIAIDLKSFYASVECVERGLDPLTTNLVVADSTKTEKTICLAVTPSLKSYGISGRARLFEAVAQVKMVNAARKNALRGRDFSGSSCNFEALEKNKSLAVDFITAPPRMALYREYSTKIVAAYLNHVSIEDLYAYSVDEVFIDATPYLDRGRISAEEFARMLILDVYNRFGITATAGIGENMYLCKIALDITAKHIQPDKFGVRIASLDTEGYRRTLWTHRPLTDFWMIGGGIARRLERHGIFTMGELARCSLDNEDMLYKEFGKNAEYIIDQAWGYEPVTIADIRSYRPESTGISSGQVLTRPYTFDETRIIVREMTENLVLGLVEKGLVTDQIVLHIGYDIENLSPFENDNSYSGEVVTDRYGRRIPHHAHGTVNTPRHTSSTKLLLEKTLALYDRITDRKLLVRRLSITANRLLSEDDAAERDFPEQLTIFDSEEELSLRDEAEEKEKRMQRAMIDIKGRFGPNAILKGTNLQEGATARERNRSIGGHKA
ncbi:MAG: DNA methylase [Clostridia bacterium]|nr:DNA methylase [Clostridia bacterium]